MTTNAEHLDPLIDPKYDLASVSDKVVDIPLAGRFPRWWLMAVGLSLCVAMLGGMSALWLLYWGPGVWGINIPVAWGFAILNFVWWIGIGHAGTLISAVLLLMRQHWRTSINRFAEAMTLFAVMNAGLFPLMHLGRWWKFYFLLPYPSTMDVWPQWRSPLVWDVIAISTYGLVSLLFWYLGLAPDLATMRDRARRKSTRWLTGVFSLGWRGSAAHWRNHQAAYLLLAGLATPLVVSVHSIVSLDFSVAMVPGWHSTIFPPYFVAGAIFSGFSMVLCLILPIRGLFKLHGLITVRHLDVMGKVMLTAGLIVAYGYIMENFTAFFSADPFEISMATNRMLGEYAPMYWLTLTCNILIPQLLWIPAVRRRVLPLFLVALAINVGMWAERYVIVIQPLHRDFMPSAWGWFTATFWDWSLFAGTLGLFSLCMLLFIRLAPMLSMSELRELIAPNEPGGDAHPADQAENGGGQATAADGPTKIAVSAREDLADHDVHGFLARFDNEEQLVDAARRTHRAGYRRIDAFTPMPVEGLADALGFRRSRIPLLVLIGALLGAGGIFAFQTWAAVFDYPWNIGGRPLFSWPSFVPLTFEVAVLGGALFGFVGFLVLNRLPQLYHPVFNAPEFAGASRDAFLLFIERRDARFDREGVVSFLRGLGPREIAAVPEYQGKDAS